MLHFLDCVESRVTVWSGFFSLIEQCWYISMLVPGKSSYHWIMTGFYIVLVFCGINLQNTLRRQVSGVRARRGNFGFLLTSPNVS